MRPAPALPLPRRKPRLCLGALTVEQLVYAGEKARREGDAEAQIAAIAELRRRRSEAASEAGA